VERTGIGLVYSLERGLPGRGNRRFRVLHVLVVDLWGIVRFEFLPGNFVGQGRLLAAVKHANVPRFSCVVELRLPFSGGAHGDAAEDRRGQ